MDVDPIKVDQKTILSIIIMKTNRGEIYTLTNGNYLIEDYGEYSTNLSFIVQKNDGHIRRDEHGNQCIYLLDNTNNAEVINGTEFNIASCYLRTLRGNFFVSKKGTNIFKVDPNGQHILLRDEWGGRWDPDDVGYRLPTGALYFYRTPADDDDSGYDYAVVPFGWKREISEEDL